MDLLFALLGAGSGGSLSTIGAVANARLRKTLGSPITTTLVMPQSISRARLVAIGALLIAIVLTQIDREASERSRREHPTSKAQC